MRKTFGVTLTYIVETDNNEPTSQEKIAALEDLIAQAPEFVGDAIAEPLEEI